MKKIILRLFVVSLAAFIVFASCKKEFSCEGCINGNNPPIVIAGPDQVITLPTDSVLLDGSASSDPDGTISEWLWRKISGPASFTISNATTAIAAIENLDTGTYRYELKVTDNGGLSAKDTMQVTVNSATPINHSPVANAGGDQSIALPTNNAMLDGGASTDPDNNITIYAWTKISGPSSFNIVNASTVQTQVNNLVEGVYQFVLKVTDAEGLFSKDTMQVTVNAQSPQLPQLCDNNRPQINAQLIPFGTLSQARLGMAVASAGNKIVFAGGWDAKWNGYSSRVDIYDMITQSWSTGELSLPRTGIAGVAAGNTIFFVGGTTGNDFAFNTVDIYDIAGNSWSTAQLSQEAYSIAATAVGNKVFFAGGNAGDNSLDLERRVIDIYDLTTDTWSTHLLSERKEYLAAVALGSKVYFAGGGNWVNPSVYNSLRSIDIYDNATNTWSTSTLQEGKMSLAGIAVADKIYWAGGNTGSAPSIYPSCVVEIKDANTGNSSIQYLSRPGAFDGGENAVVKDNKIIFYRPYGTTDTNKFDIYEIATNKWSIGILPESMPQGASIISVNNAIYVAGGSVNGVLSNQVWKLEF